MATTTSLNLESQGQQIEQRSRRPAAKLLAPRLVNEADVRWRVAGGWTAWQNHLLARRGRRDLAALFPARSTPLLWGLPDADLAVAGAQERLLEADSLDLVARLGRAANATAREVERLADELPAWLAESAGGAASVAHALESIAWGHALVPLVSQLAARTWWECLEQLVALADQSSELAANKTGSDPANGSQRLALALAGGELPLALAWLFPEIESCRQLAGRGLDVVMQGMEHTLAADGSAHCRNLPLMRGFLACWTRSLAINARIQPGRLNAAARRRFRLLVRQSLRLMRIDGSQALAPRSPAGRTAGRELLEAALQVGGGRGRQRLAGLVASRQARVEAARHAARLPAPAVMCEASRWSVLRPGWSPSSPSLTVAWPESQVRAELTGGGEVLALGDWKARVEMNGLPLEPVSEWEQTCWVSDARADYLELQLSLAGKVSLERHLLLARQDGFLFVADAILAPRSAELRYCATVPLAAGIRFDPARQTRDGFLSSRKRRARVLPLALREWRSDPRGGELAASETASGTVELELRQAASQSRALFAPLFVDLSGRRLSRPATWRQLTVADTRVIQPLDMAVGYRVQAGQQQWVFYRSLGPRGNRTLLGHNLISQFLAARFSRNGCAEALLEIE